MGRSWTQANPDFDSPQRIILEILSKTPSKSLPTADQNNINHLRTFWSSCHDEDVIDDQGLAPLLDVVEEIIAAWRGEPTTPPSKAAEFVQQAVREDGWAEAEKVGKKWDPKTKKDRLTAALMFLHSRGTSARSSSRCLH
jgi:endothelin-converting enzyme